MNGTLKQTAPQAAQYTLDGVTYKLFRERNHVKGVYKPWYAILDNYYGSGTAKQLDRLSALAAHLADVCRELDAAEPQGPKGDEWCFSQTLKKATV